MIKVKICVFTVIIKTHKSYHFKTPVKTIYTFSVFECLRLFTCAVYRCLYERMIGQMSSNVYLDTVLVYLLDIPLVYSSIVITRWWVSVSARCFYVCIFIYSFLGEGGCWWSWGIHFLVYQRMWIIFHIQNVFGSFISQASTYINKFVILLSLCIHSKIS